MHVDDVVRILHDTASAERWIAQAHFKDRARARTNLQAVARSGMTLDQIAAVCEQFLEIAADISDPDMAWNNLEKFVLAARSPLAVGSLFQRDPTALPILLRIFSASQHLSDLLIRDTESYDSLRLTEGQLYAREILVDELTNSIAQASEPMQAMQILRRFKHRETLRIAFGDLVIGHRLEHVAEQISVLAEAIIESARFFAYENLARDWGLPQSADGENCRFVVLALGKLGGRELNYSSDIDLIVVFESKGSTSIAQKPNQIFFERVTRDLIKLLNETTSLGAAYRVDMRLRPEGSRGAICCNSKSFLQYYDLQGRTWERQALIKARAVAGDLEFGNELICNLTPWIYRPILNRFDIGDIKALKRQIERRAIVSGEEQTNIKTGHGGIRDIEFVIQFLQLLNGGLIADVQTANTLEAIHKLAAADCLSRQEAELLNQNYCWLRRLEHLLQIMFDLQTHSLPEGFNEINKIAKRMGYREYFGVSAHAQFEADLGEITNVNNRILDHLLHNAFASASELESEDGARDSADLVLHSEHDPGEAERILSPFNFSDVEQAGRMIQSLGRESTRFLSSRRCRHFLAAIIPELLNEISATPDPDATLVSLSNVADAIGGKGALWELFSFNPPSLELFVRLCASSNYLSAIIRRNPGMIDELIDSLLLDRLPTIEWLRFNLNELTTGALDAGPILHSFKNVQHLRVGIRDIVGRDSILQTYHVLSDIAEVCLEKIAQIEFEKAAAKYSNLAMPSELADDRNGLVILSLGKLGGQEPNYHSDLDVVFLYDSNDSRNAWINTSAQHFYSELAAKISQVVTVTGPGGKLFDLDSRLRPSGKSGVLAVSFNEFQRYFESGDGQLWERQALCKARTVFGDSELQSLVMQLVRQAITQIPWATGKAEQIRIMRMKMQDTSRPENLKRGAGGTVDIEFIVQMLQLKHAVDCPEILVPGTIDAIDRLLKVCALDRESALYFIESYQYLRSVESRLSLMSKTSLHDLPEGKSLKQLAYLLKIDAEQLAQDVAAYRRRNRELFDLIIDEG